MKITVHKSLWVELEIVTGALAALMFGYLWFYAAFFIAEKVTEMTTQ